MDWVKCSERLPEKDGRYWCYLRGFLDSYWSEAVPFKLHANGVSGEWDCYGASLEDYEVTHWMPLPEPPKE